MSVELLDLLTNYEIICCDDDAACRLLQRNWNLSSRPNLQLPSSIANDKSIEIMLGDKELYSEVIRDNRSSMALVFYLTRRMDQLLKTANIPMLLPAYEIQEGLGDKLHLAKICNIVTIPFNHDLIYRNASERLNEIFVECRSTLGLPFIAQGALGVSGDDTFLVGTEDELLNTMTALPAGLKAARYIPNNIPLSVHACVLEDEIVVRGPFLQLLGFPELSANPFQFAGNDTNQSLFNWNIVERIREMSFRIGGHARSEGYIGILGIDYLWDQNTDAVYPQELNTARGAHPAPDGHAEGSINIS
ncbi:MAG: hypothetical protein ACREXR_01540 [Gammaproteobacteria bacterium]